MVVLAQETWVSDRQPLETETIIAVHADRYVSVFRPRSDYADSLPFTRSPNLSIIILTCSSVGTYDELKLGEGAFLRRNLLYT